MTSYKEGLNNITTFIFDVDGVLTDGSVTLYKDEIVRTLNSRDGYAIQYAVKKGYDVFILTGGSSLSVKKRLITLGVKAVVLSAKNKLNEYTVLRKKYSFRNEEVLYMGDDIPDFPVLKEVGVATCPQDAVQEIKSICDYQSPYKGGRYCVRDVIEQTLRVQGKWFQEDAVEW